MSKERIIDIVLTALLISCIVLTAITFLNFKGPGMNKSETGLSTDGDITNILEPQSYSISLGNEKYTKLNDRINQISLWRVSKQIITESSVTGQSKRMSIEEWSEEFKKAGACLKLPDGVNVKMLLEAEGKYEDLDSGLDTIMIKADERDALYFSDSRQSIFMRYDIKVTSRMEEHFSEFSSEIHRISSNNPDEYDTIASVFPAKDDEKKNGGKLSTHYNMTLIPKGSLKGISAYLIENDYDKYKKSIEEAGALEDKIRSTAGKIFGKEVGFVKMFRGTDESTTYIAGYGDMTLRYKNKGGMSFDISPSLKKSRPSMKSIFNNGIRQSVAVMNEFYKSDAHYALGSYSEVSALNEVKQTLKFTYLIDGKRSVDIMGKDSPVCEIKLNNGALFEFNIFPLHGVKVYDVSPEEVAITDILKKNKKLIAKETSGKRDSRNNGDRGGSRVGNEVAESINDISVKYAIIYDTNANTPTSKLAMPVWSLKVDRYELIFSYYSGEFIKTITEQ